MQIRFLPALAVVLTLGATIARAADLKLPAAKPVVGVSIPDAWKPEFTTRGVRAGAGDGNAYLSVEATADAKEMSTIIDGADAMLKARKVHLDRAERRDTKFKVNNFPAEEIRYIGFDESGSVAVTFTFVTIRDAAVVLVYWASEEGYKQHQAEFGKIVDSIKALGPAPSPTPIP